jgi:hypothetical protein
MRLSLPWDTEMPQLRSEAKARRAGGLSMTDYYHEYLKTQVDIAEARLEIYELELKLKEHGELEV